MLQRAPEKKTCGNFIWALLLVVMAGTAVYQVEWRAANHYRSNHFRAARRSERLGIAVPTPTAPTVIIDRVFAVGPMAVLAEPPLWRAWPHNDVIRAPGRFCRWSRFTPPATPGLEPPLNGSICLRNESDLLCDEVRRRGYWPECADLPALYERSARALAAEAIRRPRSAVPGPPLFVDAGANVGACTLHMLLSTSAKVVSFEPGPGNLFYASSSFLRMRRQILSRSGAPAAAGGSSVDDAGAAVAVADGQQQQQQQQQPTSTATAAADATTAGASNAGAEHATGVAPGTAAGTSSHDAWDDPASRLRLYPIALGAANGSSLLYSARGNAGHSVVGLAPFVFAPAGHEAAQRILVRRLDDVLWPEASRAQGEPPPTVALLKLDVEGFECKSLQGARLLLRERAIRFVKTEVFEYGLRQQGCSGVQLQQMLSHAGFALYTRDPGAPPPPGATAAAPIDPAVLIQTVQNNPYNLYCVQSQPFPRPEWRRRLRAKK